MNMKKLLCLLLALMMMSAAALAESSEDLQAMLDEAVARIEELEAEVELYRPYYEAQIVAEYGDGGIVWLEDAQEEYAAAASTYSQYGMNVDDYAADIKPMILEYLVRDGVLAAKAEELGMTDLDETVRADLEAQAAQNFETYVTTYQSSFAAADADEETARQQTIDALAMYGITVEALTDTSIKNYVDEQLYNYVTADVAVTDEDIRAAYDQMVADDQSAYESDDRSYNNARSSGETIAWNPEGYRAVKHVLIAFNDEQSAAASDLRSTLSSLNDELDALNNPEAEETEAPAEGEAEAEPRTAEEIQADIDAANAELDALYAELLPKAQQVIDEFNDGASFDELIAVYGEDPGMMNEPTASEGYAVAADSTAWDAAFTEGAMSIAEVGGISEPVYGSYGIHIIYYMADITPGAVPFETLADAAQEKAMQEAVSAAYNAQLDAWVEEANPVYHVDRF